MGIIFPLQSKNPKPPGLRRQIKKSPGMRTWCQKTGTKKKEKGEKELKNRVSRRRLLPLFKFLFPSFFPLPRARLSPFLPVPLEPPFSTRSCNPWLKPMPSHTKQAGSMYEVHNRQTVFRNHARHVHAIEKHVRQTPY